MSATNGHEGHGGGGGGGNVMGECLFGYCDQVKGAASQITGMFSFLVNGIFDSGGGSGGGHH